MSKMSLLDKLNILIEVSKNSLIYIGLIIILIILGIIFIKTNKKNSIRNQKIYLIFLVLTTMLITITYHAPLNNLFDYMMNNLFIAIYFPTLAIYFAAIIITNIIVIISIFNFKTSEIIRKTNIVVFILMNYLLALTLNVINREKLDVFTQSSIYSNKTATALIELSSILFIIWIIFLIIYKIIIIILKKEYKPKVKRIIIRRSIKKLPKNYEAKNIPKIVYQKKNTTKTIINTIVKEKNDIEETLTIDDYKLILKMLKEQKEKERMEKLKEETRRKEQEKFIELQALYNSVR